MAKHRRRRSFRDDETPGSEDPSIQGRGQRALGRSLKAAVVAASKGNCVAAMQDLRTVQALDGSRSGIQKSVEKLVFQKCLRTKGEVLARKYGGKAARATGRAAGKAGRYLRGKAAVAASRAWQKVATKLAAKLAKSKE